MLRYEHIADKSKDFLAMTGYHQKEFAALLPKFQECYDAYLREYTIDGYDRTGYVPRTYKNCPLPMIEDKLLFVLVQLKQNPTQTLQGYLFGMSQSNVNKWFHLLHAVLNRTLAAHNVLPQRDMEITAADETDDLLHGQEDSLLLEGVMPPEDTELTHAPLFVCTTE